LSCASKKQSNKIIPYGIRPILKWENQRGNDGWWVIEGENEQRRGHERWVIRRGKIVVNQIRGMDLCARGRD
jgi:hypothetical protein